MWNIDQDAWWKSPHTTIKCLFFDCGRGYEVILDGSTRLNNRVNSIHGSQVSVVYIRKTDGKPIKVQSLRSQSDEIPNIFL